MPQYTNGLLIEELLAFSRALTIQIPDPITVKDPAEALGQRPFQVVGDLMELGRIGFEDDPVESETTSKVAKKYGCEAKRQG